MNAGRAEAGKRTRRKVLVVDDSQIVLEIVRERLESIGFDVTLRSEPLGSGQWIAENQPEFVLLDVQMPALSGGGLASLLKKRATTRDTRLIFHSSLSPSELAELVRTTGAAGAIQKTDDDYRFLQDLIAIVGPLRQL
jgi:CheY-like chemotaxis protein